MLKKYLNNIIQDCDIFYLTLIYTRISIIFFDINFYIYLSILYLHIGNLYIFY